MDTLILPRPREEKTATSAAGIGIALILLVAQNSLISAHDGLTGLSPTLSIKERQQIQEEIFENEILKKYKNLKVVEVDKGIKYVKAVKYYNKKPVRINIVEVSKEVNADLTIEPVIASDTLASRRQITPIASREDAIVAINGGYFKPQTGVPLGTLMINKKIYTGPIYDRVALGIFNNGYGMARVKLNARIKTNNGDLIVDNINQPRMLSTNTIVYTPDWGGYTPPSPKYGTQVVVSDNKIMKITDESTRIPENGYVIVAPKSKTENIEKAKKVSLELNTEPEWKGVNHIISGGPYLVKDGEIFVDMTDEKLTAIGGRNPRTAIGYTKDNTLIMVTADGREGASIGLTLNELAYLMKSLGCINAMNLDGGGSTVMFVNGRVVNKPPMEGGIPLSHTLIVRKNYRLSKI